MHNDSDLVYSTDPEKNKRCGKCKKLLSSCKCSKESTEVDFTKIKVLVRLERAHRGGKDVTVIDRLPPLEPFLKDLAKKLKKMCGSGGTFKIEGGKGSVEIQGDKQEKVRIILQGMGFKGNWK